jgi:methylamine--corrinoid protein Co-methyltransferase
VTQDYTTGMEARMMGEASVAVAGMRVPEVNSILDRLVASYEKNYAKAPEGKSFRECYDVNKVIPTKEYIEIYGKAIVTLQGFGVPIK